MGEGGGRGKEGERGRRTQGRKVVYVPGSAGAQVGEDLPDYEEDGRSTDGGGRWEGEGGGREGGGRKEGRKVVYVPGSTGAQVGEDLPDYEEDGRSTDGGGRRGKEGGEREEDARKEGCVRTRVHWGPGRRESPRL